MTYLISSKQLEIQRRNASVHDDYDGPCQCCGKDKETFQNDDYAWICNLCYWTGGPQKSLF